MTATAKKAAPKKAATKLDTARCRWGEGRYLSPKTSKACASPRNPKRQLCDPCELKYRAAKKAAGPAKPKAEKKHQSAGTSPKTTGDPMARELSAVKAMKAAAARQDHSEPASPDA